MNLNKTLLSTAIVATLSAAVVTPAQAVVLDMSYEGVFTMLDPAGLVFQNNTSTSYYDPTWGYGLRTQVSGTMSFDTDTGAGSGTVEPFSFLSDFGALASGVAFQSIGGGLILGNMNWSYRKSYRSYNMPIQIVLDGSGLFAAIDGGLATPGATIDQTTCGSLGGACATPASETSLPKGRYPIGPVPIATSSFNTVGQTGTTTTLGQLSLGTDDGIGGSPMDNGPFHNYNANLDFTSLTVTEISSVPIPAAVWLFGSGLIGLIGVARRKARV